MELTGEPYMTERRNNQPLRNGTIVSFNRTATDDYVYINFPYDTSYTRKRSDVPHSVKPRAIAMFTRAESRSESTLHMLHHEDKTVLRRVLDDVYDYWYRANRNDVQDELLWNAISGLLSVVLPKPNPKK